MFIYWVYALIRAVYKERALLVLFRVVFICYIHFKGTVISRRFQ